MEHYLEIEPAFDKRDPDPKKNYGIHGVTIKWICKGNLGAVQFVLYTNWMLAHVENELDNLPSSPRFLQKPMPADLGYHSKIPMYDSHMPMGSTKLDFDDWDEFKLPDSDESIKLPKTKQTGTMTRCEYTDYEPCFYNGSGLAAQKVFNILKTEGGKGVKNYLEAYYTTTLGVEVYPWKFMYIFYKDYKWFYLYRHVSGFWERSKDFDTPEAALKSKIFMIIKILFKRSKKNLVDLFHYLKTYRKTKDKEDVLKDIFSSN